MRFIFTLLPLLLSVASAGFGIKGFLLPAGFIDGGITGISMLLSHYFGISLPPLLVLINSPFLLLGWAQVGLRFFLLSALAISLLVISLVVVPFPRVTSEPLLAAVFGGMFLGSGIGLSIRAGAVLDGTEILALLLSRKISLTVGDVVLFFNVIIFTGAALILGVEPALYSVITYAAAAKSMDFLLHGIEEYFALLIVSDKSDNIRAAVVGQLGRSVTRLKGFMGLAESPQEVLYVVLTRLEISSVKALILTEDPKAFIVVQPVRDVSGGIIKARPLDRL